MVTGAPQTTHQWRLRRAVQAGLMGVQRSAAMYRAGHPLLPQPILPRKRTKPQWRLQREQVMRTSSQRRK